MGITVYMWTSVGNGRYKCNKCGETFVATEPCECPPEEELIAELLAEDESPHEMETARGQRARLIALAKAMAAEHAQLVPEARTITACPPARAQMAVELLSSGLRYTQARDRLCDHFEVSQNSAETYLKRAYELLRDELEETLPQRKQRLVNFLWRNARKAEKAGKYGQAVAAARVLAKIDGLDNPGRRTADAAKIEITALRMLISHANVRDRIEQDKAMEEEARRIREIRAGITTSTASPETH